MTKPLVPLKIVWADNYRTAQIYSMGFEFAFLSPAGKKKFEQATTFVYCKDFLHDAVWAMVNQEAYTIYGFKYDPKKDKPLCLTHTALAFRNTKQKAKPEGFHNRLENCRELLHQVEKKLGFRPSFLQVAENPDGPCWIILGDKRWQLSPPLLSLYTLLIRVGMTHELGRSVEQTLELAEKKKYAYGEAGSNDASYLKQGMKGIQAILKHGASIFYAKIAENYPEKLKKHGLHDNFGIVSFTGRQPEECMPHWFRAGIWE